MGLAWEDSQRAFADAAGMFVDLAARTGDRWGQPGLGEWDVRALVGHTSRSLLTVESYLAQPAMSVELETPADYYRAIRAAAAGPGVVARGRDAGLVLGPEPAAAVATISNRVVALVGEKVGTELLTTLAGGMRLSDYLPTRTLELTVHSLDLAAALDEPVDLPPTAAAQTLRIVADLAVSDGRAAALLLAATGRASLPPGFSVL